MNRILGEMNGEGKETSAAKGACPGAGLYAKIKGTKVKKQKKGDDLNTEPKI